MPTDWPTFELAALVDRQRGISYGIVQPGNPVQDGVPILRVNNVRNGRIDTSAPLRVSPEIEQAYSRTRLRGGELIITVVGTVGETAIVPANLAGWNVARAIAVLPIVSDVGPYWIKQALLAPSVRAMINSRLNTTVQTTLNLGDLGRLPITLPPRKQRESISAILGALDDKIELNRRMNETLEAMARTIFKDWFVDFGPTRMKMEGRQPDLAPDIWSLFPDRLDDDGKPEGWRRSTVGEEYSLTMGQSPPGETYNDDRNGLPFFQGRTDFGFRYPVPRKYCSAPTRLALVDDTLISVRAPVGDLNMAWEDCCIGRGVAAARHRSGARGFTYYAFQSIQPSIQRFEDTGSVFGAINKVQFERLAVIDPGSPLIQRFESTVQDLDELIRANTGEIETLAATRDLLLPKLISGEIRVRDAEKIAEEKT